MSYYAVETQDANEPMKYFDTLEEAKEANGVIFICDENHVCQLLDVEILIALQKKPGTCKPSIGTIRVKRSDRTC